jgi:manganese transport protein
MGEFTIRPWIQGLAWLVAGVIVSLNIKLVIDQIAGWLEAAGDKAWILQVTVVPLTVAIGLLLIYVTLHPWLRERIKQIGARGSAGIHQQAVELDSATLVSPPAYKRVAVALDFSGKDEKLLTESLRFIDKVQTQVTLLHVVESPVARTYGAEAEDLETLKDKEHLEQLAQKMKKAGVNANWQINSGDPVSGLANMINEFGAEMVIVGSHGHSGVSDLIHGTVISNLRHHIKASVMIVPMGM